MAGTTFQAAVRRWSLDYLRIDSAVVWQIEGRHAKRPASEAFDN